MDMTFQQYIDNPLGKKNAVFSQRDMYRALYTDKFDKLLLREAGKINFALYFDRNTDRYIIHVKVPSETVKNFYYDAVIMFYTDDPVQKHSNTLNRYYVKFFSNDPAFVFTYLRVFLKNGLFFEDMKPKSSKQALKKDPKEKNPYEIPGYSKILYFAFLYMKAKNLFSKAMYNTYGEQYSAKKLLEHVEHTDKKIADRQRLGEEEARRAAAEKRKAAKHDDGDDSTSRIISPTGNIRGVSRTRTVGSSKRTNAVKTTRRTATTKRK